MEWQLHLSEWKIESQTATLTPLTSGEHCGHSLQLTGQRWPTTFAGCGYGWLRDDTREKPNDCGDFWNEHSRVVYWLPGSVSCCAIVQANASNIMRTMSKFFVDRYASFRRAQDALEAKDLPAYHIGHDQNLLSWWKMKWPRQSNPFDSSFCFVLPGLHLQKVCAENIDNSSSSAIQDS